MGDNKKATDEQQETWEPPRGMRYVLAAGRPSPFGLRWIDRASGARHAQFFESEGSREAEAQRIAVGWAKPQARVAFMSAADGREFTEAKEAAGGADLRAVVREWQAMKAEQATASTITVAEAVNQYLGRRYAGGINRQSDTGRHFELHLRKRFAGQFGTMRLSDVTAEAIRQWLPTIKSKKAGRAIGPLAQRHHRKDINTFFDRAVREGWVKVNPCELVDLPKIPAKDVQILTVDQARTLMLANAGLPIAARLALELFGGLRASSVERLKKEHIDWDRKGIRLPGELHKSGKTKYRQGHPEILWEWLRAAPEKTWTDIDERNYGHEKVKAIRRAFGQDATLPHNACRHSFASYHLAAFKALSTTSYLMQHTSTHTTTIYEGVATEADATAYFEIRPL